MTRSLTTRDVVTRMNKASGVLRSALLGPAQTRVKKHETRNKKQNGLAHLRFLVCVTPKQQKTLLDLRIKFLAKHV